MWSAAAPLPLSWTMHHRPSIVFNADSNPADSSSHLSSASSTISLTFQDFSPCA